jgi:hypothetical protein
MRLTIPVRDDDYGDDAERSTARSRSKSPALAGKSSSRFPGKPPGFGQSIPTVVAQMSDFLRKNIANIVVGGLLGLAVFLLITGLDISPKKSRYINVVPLDPPANGSPKASDRKPGASDAINSGTELPCLKRKIPDTLDQNAEQFSRNIGAIKKAIREGRDLSKKELQVLNALLKRESDYLGCLGMQ